MGRNRTESFLRKQKNIYHKKEFEEISHHEQEEKEAIHDKFGDDVQEPPTTPFNENLRKVK